MFISTELFCYNSFFFLTLNFILFDTNILSLQMFDMLIVLLSLGAEIAFLIEHEELLCYHEATVAVKFIIVLRLWRIPRACDSKFYFFPTRTYS